MYKFTENDIKIVLKSLWAREKENDKAAIDLANKIEMSREDHYCYRDDFYGDDEDSSPVFAREGSALRASGPGNPRNLSCPTCKAPNVLTPEDRRRGYQCDACADRAEGLTWE